MKTHLVCLSLILATLGIPQSVFAQPEVQARVDSSINAYIASHQAFAVAEMERTGIPASVTLAQAICESRYGTSRVALNAHNHFGIKCYDSWPGKRYFHKDDEYKNGVLVPSCFRYYTSDSLSYVDHSNFLLSRPWYEHLFNYDSDDYVSWTKGLNKSGYANAKDYDQRLLKYIKKFELYNFDKKGFPTKTVKEERRREKERKKMEKEALANAKKKPVSKEPVFIAKDTVAAPNSIIEQPDADNSAENITASTEPKLAGTSIRPKLQRFSLGKSSTSEITTPENEPVPTITQDTTAVAPPIPVPDVPKVPAIHIVAANETLFGISKKYGIALNKLLEVNHLTLDSVVKIGYRLIIEQP